ncbi:MAG TPA: hypothetical protein VHW01_17875 [Polyangiaceae bacterium]|nr:hypothetical protein [Polyangiaceae bacterium]
MNRRGIPVSRGRAVFDPGATTVVQSAFYSSQNFWATRGLVGEAQALLSLEWPEFVEQRVELANECRTCQRL